MNKQLAKKGTTLNKNMTNTESLNLTNLVSTTANIAVCTSNYVKANAVACNDFDIPIDPPKLVYPGTMYFNITTKTLYISDGTKKANSNNNDYTDYNWYCITLTQAP